MPDFAPDYTPRYRARYNNAGVEHTVMVRGYRGETAVTTVARSAGALFSVFDILANAGYLCDDFLWLSADYTPEDSNVSSPTTLPAAVVGTTLLSGYSVQDKITSLGFVGRAQSTPARLFVFGIAFPADVAAGNIGSDFRLLTSEDTAIANAVAALNAAGLAANNNFQINWNNYVNLKVNDYWLRQARKGVVS